MNKPETYSFTGVGAIKSILEDSTRLYYFIYKIKQKIRITEDPTEKERLINLLNEIEKYRPEDVSDVV